MKIIFKNTVTVLTMVLLASTLIGCGDSIENTDTRKMGERAHRMKNTNPSSIAESQHKMKNTNPSSIAESQHKMENN